jgi:aerobic carbon-monoxide dehydrogenase large subunit
MDSLIGKPLPRKEDHRLLTGAGAFIDDLTLPDQVYAVMLRSPHAHARIRATDTAAAAQAPQVLAVLTGRDYAADGLGSLNHNLVGVDHLDIAKPSFTPDNIRGPLPLHTPIATDRVRHVGEPVAVIIATSREAAQDAAELVSVDYDILPAVTDVREALAADAPRLWPDRPDNLCVQSENGDRAAVEAALRGAHKVVKLASHNQRVSAAPMEPRAAVAEWSGGSLTLYSPSQGVHRHKNALVAIFALPPAKVRVVTGDVGGGFGARSPCYPEYPLVAWAARRLGRPVKWTATRQEAFISDFQSRDVFVEGALALDRDGRFLALSLDYIGNLGAYPASFAVLANILRMAAGVYDIPALHVRVRGVTTNTLPIGVYRGAGRPESNFLVERLVDLAAAEFSLDRAEIRRRNLIEKLPYQSPLGHRYDTGAFAANMATALRAVDWSGFAARRAAAAKRGRLAGIAIVNYLESPTGWPGERTDIKVAPVGEVSAVIGTGASGQGHETSFAQVVASRLQIPFDQVAIRFGDSDVAISGGGSHSDRSMRLGGFILLRAADEIIERGRKLAAQHLEAAEADIAYADGRFTVAGTDRSLGLYEAAAVAPIAATAEVRERLHAHPNGAAACEVEIDPEIGAVTILRYATVDDVGMMVNPMIVAGQVHGGIAQGVGQALMEQCAYDRAGQLINGSFMDYCMPRADNFPAFAIAATEIAAESNPLGIKGAGECGTTPATAVIIGAIVDALQAFGVKHLEMPATSERIWRAIRDAGT